MLKGTFIVLEGTQSKGPVASITRSNISNYTILILIDDEGYAA